MKLDIIEKIDEKNFKYIDEEGFLYCLPYKDIDEDIKVGHKRFSKNNPFTIENINNYIKINKISTKLISKEYLYASKNNYLIFECGMCQQHFQRTWNHFYSGKYKYCQECICKIQANEKCFSLKQIEEKCKEKGLKVIQKEYFGNRGILDVEDINGYRGRTTWNNINNNKNFIKFRVNNPYFYYNIRNYFYINGYNCDVIENSGNERKGKFTFVCECGRHYVGTLDEVTNNVKPRIRCKSCSNTISSGEKAIIDWLKNNNINYNYQYKFQNCKYKRELPFDFYLPDYNICIEFDGIYHYEKQKHISDKQFEEQKIRDEIKNKFCQDNNIKLIRIPYWTLYNKKYKSILKKNILVQD